MQYLKNILIGPIAVSLIVISSSSSKSTVGRPVTSGEVISHEIPIPSAGGWREARKDAA